jgi:histidinol-phosphate aminotransferase
MSHGIIREIPTLFDYASDQGKVNESFSLIDCGLGHSAFGYPPEVDEARNLLTAKLLSEYAGDDPFSKSLARPVRSRFNLKDTTDVFFNGAGSYGMLADILNDFVDPQAIRQGLTIVGFGPQFTNINMLANRAGIPYRPVEPELGETQSSKLQHLIESRRSAKKPAIVYIDNPNNPTGNANTIAEIRQLVAETSGRDVLIVDEAYGDLLPDSESAIPLTEEFNNLIVIRSLSKGIGLASPRLGYSVMSPNIAEAYKKIELVFGIDTFTRLLGMIALNPDTLSTFLLEVQNKTATIKTELISGLETMGIQVFPTVPTVSIFLAKGNDHFHQKLLDKGINTEDGATFKPTHSKMDGSMVRMRIPNSSDQVGQIHQRIWDIQKGK